MFPLIAPINGFSLLRRSGVQGYRFRELNVKQQNNVLQIQVLGPNYPPCSEPGEYDAMAKLTEEFEMIDQKIADGSIGVKKVVCDFSKVNYLNSEGLGSLLLLNRTLSERGGELEFCGVNSQLAEVLRITKLNKIFKIV